MQRSGRKLISLVLVVMLVLTSLTLVPTSVAAAEEGHTFQYIDNQNWGACYLYAFNDDGDVGTGWPGISLESFGVNDSGEKLYEINVPAGATGIVLSNGNGDQTVNIVDFDVTGYYATGERDGEGHLLVVSWKDEPATEDSTEPETEPETEETSEPETEPVTEEPSEPETEPVTEPETEPETEEPSESATQYVYYDNSYDNWAAPYAYFWIGGTYNSFAPWPGGAMESVGNNIYRAEIPSGGYDMVIFNNNRSPQTGDLTIPGDGYIYRYNATINDYEWALYTTEPVTEPETEPETEPVTDPGSEPVPVDAPNNDIYVVSGNYRLFEESWIADPNENVMNYYSDGLYRITLENVEYDPDAIYSFKVVRFLNGESYYNEWIGYNGTDYNVDFSLSQSCDVTIIYDPDTREIRVEGDGVIPPAYQIDSITAVGDSNGNFLNGCGWDPYAEENLMEEVEDGVYEITFYEVDTGTDYQFKFAANNSWDINWGDNTGNYATTGEYHPAVFNSGDYIRFDLNDYEEDYADVTLVLDIRNWDPITKEGARYAILINGETIIPDEAKTVNFINTLGWERPVVYAYDSNGDILPEASASEPVRTASNQRKEKVHTFMLPEETASFAFGDGDKLTTTASDHTKTYYTLGDLTPGGEYVLLEDNPNFNFSIKGTIDFNHFINAQVNQRVISAYRFIPAEDMDVVFRSITLNDNTYGYIFDANGNELVSGNYNYYDYDGNYYDFRIDYHLTAGQTYYFGCRYYRRNSGEFPISLERAVDQQGTAEIVSVNAYGDGHDGFLNNDSYDETKNQMTQIQKDVYAITFDNIASGQYSFCFSVNDGAIYFYDNQWTQRETNTVYDAYSRGSYEFRFYLNEESNITLIFDARAYDPQTGTGAKYEVITEPVSSTRQIRSLTLLDDPTKTSYIAGEKVDLTGMTLVALYSDKTSEIVDYCDVSPLVVTEDTTEVTLTYKGLTQSFPVTVTPAELTSLVLVSTPTQRQYYEGDTLNLDGCVVKAVYNDGALTKTVTDYTVSADLSTPGIKTVILTYGDKSAQFDIVVNKLFINEFWVSRNPDKTKYYRGETFDPTGMELKARYNSGREFIVESYAVEEFNTENFGNGAGYARFTIDNLNGGTISTDIWFDVVPRTLAVALTGQPEKTIYINGDPLDTTGLQVYVVMEDGTAHEISEKPLEEPVAEKTIQFTNNRGWNKCCMIAYDADGNVIDSYYPYNSYVNDFGETVYLFTVPDEAAQFRFTDGNREFTEYISDMNVAGYYTNGDTTPDGDLRLYFWGVPGENIPDEALVADGYTVSELKDRAGRQSITVEYKDKQAYFFVDVFDMGDVNSDGVVSVADVTALQKYLVELNDLDDLQTQLADINGDGEVDVRDATLIQMLISEIV